MPVIKKHLENLRTNLNNLLPNLFSFAKFSLIAIMSGIIWLLHCIGWIVDIGVHYAKFIKSEIKGEDNGSK